MTSIHPNGLAPRSLRAIQLGACLLILAASLGSLQGDDLEAEPIRYSESTPRNLISRLQERINAGTLTLSYDPQRGYLPSVLKALGVDPSSQMLVFSKTSLQRHRIGPKTPRALYFNDEVYVGYCHQGDVMEFSAVDPMLGTVFYTLDQQDQPKPVFRRQWDSCLICHGSSALQGYPGHLVRSVYPDSQGHPILSTATFRTDQSSPWKQRWGGWYVTGTSGQQWHMGNLIVEDKRRVDASDLKPSSHRAKLDEFFDVRQHLTPQSDVVALMVFEHQTEMHNRLTRANLQTRRALHEASELRRELKLPAHHEFESTNSRLRAAGEPLVKYLFFVKETPLGEPIQGRSAFARHFPAAGPRDDLGRSLRDLDLQRRLFKYPCSYLIYSEAFDALPEPMLDYVYRRMNEILSGQDRSPEFAHLSPPDRRAILEILLATKRTIPPVWRKAMEATLRQ